MPQTPPRSRAEEVVGGVFEMGASRFVVLGWGAGAVEVLQVGGPGAGPRCGAGGSGAEVGQGVVERPRPEGAQRGVEFEFAFFDERAHRGPDGEDLGEAGYVDDGVQPHGFVGPVGIEEADGSARADAFGVPDRPHRAGVDRLANAGGLGEQRGPIAVAGVFSVGEDGSQGRPLDRLFAERSR